MASTRRPQPASRSATAHGATGSAAQASRVAPTAARALRVVELVAEDPTRRWRMADLQRRLGFSHGNLHAILATLVAMGHLQRDDARSYSLGPALVAIGAAARRTFPAVDLALPHLEALAAELGTEAHAAMRAGGSLVVAARCGPALPAGAGVHVGERFPLTPPMGSTVMAWADEEELERYLATAADALSPDEIEGFRRSLAAVRRRGYSVHRYRGPNRALRETAARVVTEGLEDDAWDELTVLAHELARHDYLAEEPDAWAIGEGVQWSAPVFDPAGAVALSVGVAFVGPDAEVAAVARAPELLVAAAAEITAALGGERPRPGRPRR